LKIDLIVGARPNFIKIASIIDAIKKQNLKTKIIDYRIVHTGQHYDRNMSTNFFNQLEIPFPDVNLGAGGGTQAEQTSKIMIGYESLLKKETTDLCLVVGDVTSTMACSIVAKKMGIKVAHVEAGIRSWDLTMPEEINRMVTDSISDYFFTTSKTASDNLKNSGFSAERIFFVGNTMIDTLLKYQNKFIKPDIWNNLKLEKNNFIIMTLHRPANVDEEQVLKTLINEIIIHSCNIPIIFPVHPRTAKKLKFLGPFAHNFHTIGPLGYLEFNYLVEKAKAVITDSGGITEEATVMKIPCMTLRNNTERPETVEIGTNELIGTDPQNIAPAMQKLFSDNWKKGKIPDLWDGRTAIRIVDNIIQF
jgi:UDP-N-acetylglucosamine 2-epimerase (non-hydrolysing)